jgi:hypothetical protein
MKTLILPIALTLIAAERGLAIHQDEGMKPVREPHTGWFGGRRGSGSQIKNNDVLMSSAMHSFTGIEGIDHDTKAPPTEETKKNKKNSSSKPKVNEEKNVEMIKKEPEYVNGK